MLKEYLNKQNREDLIKLLLRTSDINYDYYKAITGQIVLIEKKRKLKNAQNNHYK